MKLKTLLPICLIVSTAALADRALAESSQTIYPAGSQGSFEGPADLFTGKASVDLLFPVNDSASFSGAYVTFEPGARSAWHVHPAGQHIIVISGVGLTQEWGGPIVEIRPNDVVWCPPGVKHWHGASRDATMTHLVITGTKDGNNVEWLEKVTDAQYNGQ